MAYSIQLWADLCSIECASNMIVGRQNACENAKAKCIPLMLISMGQRCGNSTAADSADKAPNGATFAVKGPGTKRNGE